MMPGRGNVVLTPAPLPRAMRPPAGEGVLNVALWLRSREVDERFPSPERSEGEGQG